MKKRILNSEVIFGVVMILVSLYFILTSRSYPGTQNGVPGAGYFPMIAGCGVIFFSVLLIIQGIREPHEYFKIDKALAKNLIQMIEVIAALAVFLVLWNFIPFIPAALIYVLALCFILKQPAKFSVIYSVGLVLVLYLIFSVAFKVKLNIN